MRTACRIGFALAAAVLAVATVRAETFPARVVTVIDGDTVIVRDERNVRHEVRLLGIDAPEIRQAYGTRSRSRLVEIAYGRCVAVTTTHRDRYGRLLAHVVVQDCDRPPCTPYDLSQAQVAGGYAWHDKPHADEQRPDERLRYSRAELDARTRRLGLWAAPAPLAPWVYRHRYRRP